MQDTSERKKMVCRFANPPQWCIEGSCADFPKDENGMLGKCRQWVHLFGKDPQSEKTIDQWDCSIAWLPTIGAENSQMMRHAGAATEQVRNILAGALRPAPQQRLPGEPPPLIEGAEN
jgi:hypothetical protein